MSHIQVGGVDLCDNLPNPEALTAQTRNLNETNTHTNTQSLSPSQNEDRGGERLIQEATLSDCGKEGYVGRGEEDEEEDVDEVMKEEEEDEESEGSNCLVRCQSPGTPMTDSSYSETGSLLDTPFPFSPGTSPEPTSPVLPVIIPDTAFPLSKVELSQNDVREDSHNPKTESVASDVGATAMKPIITKGPLDPSTVTLTSDSRSNRPPKDSCITANSQSTTAERLTSPTVPLLNAGPTASVASTSVSAGHPAFTTGTAATGTTGPLTLNWEHIITSTAVPSCFSVPTCPIGPIPSPALLKTLEQLAQRGDEPQLPQYLHQIAEAFVLQEDYQRALWCIQLERLYHQRVLDNLNALQQQWESQCSSPSSDLAAQHLDTLKHICQTHSRPSARDAVCASQEFLKPTLEAGGALPPCTSASRTDGGIEQRAEDSSLSQSSCQVVPSIHLADGLNSPEMSEQDREDPDRQSQGRDRSDRDGKVAEGGEKCTIPVIGNELHPSQDREMDQSKPAEQQGGDLGLTPEKEAKREEEECEVEEAAEALEMEDEGDEEEEEKQQEEKVLAVETLVSGADVQHLHEETLAEERLHEDSQDDRLPPCDVKQQDEEDIEEEDEEDYEVEQADIIREAAVLDDMARLITVEELSPASGLVSILKKRKVCDEDRSEPAPPEPRPEKPAKRRVRFKVPDDGYEHDVGGGDSCLLLFLLCLVTVVISVGGTALYCALGDAHSSVCQDFSRNADFYMGQLQRGIAHIQHWFTPGS